MPVIWHLRNKGLLDDHFYIYTGSMVDRWLFL